MKDKLLEILKRDAFRRGQFTLASGRTSSYYIDARLVTFAAEGAYLIGKAVCDGLVGTNTQAVGGLTMGADPIAVAVAIESYQRGAPIPAFLVRKEAKEHGTMRRIEGPLIANARVAIVDDVITSGGSIFKAIEAVEEVGCTVSKVIVIVDRLEGGADELLRRGYDFEAMFTIHDFGV